MKDIQNAAADAPISMLDLEYPLCRIRNISGTLNALSSAALESPVIIPKEAWVDPVNNLVDCIDDVLEMYYFLLDQQSKNNKSGK